MKQKEIELWEDDRKFYLVHCTKLISNKAIVNKNVAGSAEFGVMPLPNEKHEKEENKAIIYKIYYIN